MILDNNRNVNFNYNFWLSAATISLIFLWLRSSVGWAKRAVDIAWASRWLLLSLHWRRRVIRSRKPTLVGRRDWIVGWRAPLSTTSLDCGGRIRRNHGSRAGSVRRDSLVLRRMMVRRVASLRTDPCHHHLVVG